MSVLDVGQAERRHAAESGRVSDHVATVLLFSLKGCQKKEMRIKKYVSYKNINQSLIVGILFTSEILRSRFFERFTRSHTHARRKPSSFDLKKQMLLIASP